MRLSETLRMKLQARDLPKHIDIGGTMTCCLIQYAEGGIGETTYLCTYVCARTE